MNSFIVLCIVLYAHLTSSFISYSDSVEHVFEQARVTQLVKKILPFTENEGSLHDPVTGPRPEVHYYSTPPDIFL
jgi:hypothetical protein